MLRPRPQYAHTRDGLSIAYASIGEGPLAIVVAPGLLSQVEVAWEEPAFEEFMSRLATFARVVTFDRRGIGLSDPVDRPDQLSLSNLALDIEAVLSAVGTDRAVLIGASSGSMTSVEFAASYPHRCLALVLFGATAKVTSTPDFPWGIDAEELDAWATAAAASWGTGASVARSADEHMTWSISSPAMDSDERYRAWVARIERHSGSPSVIARALRYAGTYDVRDRLPLIAAPTLILHRQDDASAAVQHARYIAAHIPNATYLEMAGVDHTFFLGDHRVVIDAILRFLDDEIGDGRLGSRARRAIRQAGFGYGWRSLTPAARLGKSRHTVDGRLRRIYEKLDVSSRAAVAAEYARTSQ
jgi:pimeloyl-ACP methyl ester carboxylesterase